MRASETVILFLTYNNKDTIGKALDDLVSQEYSNYDLFIFDDFSTDGTYEICYDYAKKYNNIKLYRNDKNLGVLGNCSLSLNFLYNEIYKYSFFLWACPDDEWDKEYLKSCIQTLKENKSYVACQSYISVTYKKSQLSYVQKYETLMYNSPFRSIRKIFKHLDSNGFPLCYNQCIHSVIRSEFLYKLFPLENNRFINYLVCELSIVGLMVAYGGLIINEKILSTKNIYEPFEKLNPSDAFSIMKNNKINYFISSFKILRVIADGKIKNKFCLVYIFWRTLVFYVLQPPYIRLKIYIYEKFIKRLKNVK